MTPNDLFAERAVRFARPASHYAMAVAPDGRFLAVGESGALSTTDEASDETMWRHIETRLENAVHAVVLAVADIETGYTIVRGPELLPSEYLAHFRAHGWVCLTSILTPAIVDALQRIACTDGHAQRTPDRSRRQICQGGALAKTALEPVSVWLARRYMQTDDIRLAHSPGIGVMTPDDGKRTVQGWRSLRRTGRARETGVPALDGAPFPRTGGIARRDWNRCGLDRTHSAPVTGPAQPHGIATVQ